MKKTKEEIEQIEKSSELSKDEKRDINRLWFKYVKNKMDYDPLKLLGVKMADQFVKSVKKEGFEIAQETLKNRRNVRLCY